MAQKIAKVRGENKFVPGLKAFGLIVFGVGIGIFWAGISHAPSEQQFTDFISGGVIMGVGIGIVAALSGWFDCFAGSRELPTERYYSVALLMALAAALFIKQCGMRQIGGWDDATMLDLGWRIYQGQVPNRDFPCAFPIAFILGVKFAFKLFGVYWSSTVNVNALFAAVTYLWSSALLADLFGRRWLMLFWALTLQAATTMMLSFWWYNSTTTVSSFLYAASALVWLRRPQSILALISYAGALLLLATMKANSAGILISIISITLFLSRPHRWKTLAVSAFAFGLFELLLAANSMSVGEMIKGYLSVAQRAGDLHHFLRFLDPAEKYSIIFTGVLAIAPVLAILGIYRKNLVSHRPSLSLLIPGAVIFAGCSGFFINSDQYMDATMIVFGAVFLLAELGARSAEAKTTLWLPVPWTRYLTWVCVVFAASGLAQGAAREHVKSAGYPLFFEYDGSRFVIDHGFFKGLHCGVIFNEMLKEEETVVNQAQSSTVWFGPRMQWGYPAFDKPDPHNQASWWEPGSAFAKSDEPMYFERFLASHFDVLVLFKNDMTYYTDEEKQRIIELYDVNQSNQLLTVMRLKK